MTFRRVLLDAIEMEKAGEAYTRSEEDKIILKKMLSEVNSTFGTKLKYLSELESYHIRGSGEIMIKYLNQFHAEGIRAFIVPHIAQDKVKGCEDAILQAYMRFKNSSEYYITSENPSPAYIYVRYDYAFNKIKPKKKKKELLLLASNPKDADHLPFTMRMLASWKLPELCEILISYLDDNNITYESIGLLEYLENVDSHQILLDIRRDLKFIALEGLKYYPSERVYNLLNTFSKSPDKDIAYTANKSLQYLEKHSVECGGKDSWITC